MFETAAETSGDEHKRDSMPTMGFLDHLEELRRRLVYAIAAVAVGFCACWWKVEKIYDIMQRPIMDALRANGMSEKLVYLNPTEPFNLYLKISALAGLFLTSPFVLYQVWMFISPGLYRNEKRYVVPFMVSTIALFSAGGYFGYRVVYPQALTDPGMFSIIYGGASGAMQSFFRRGMQQDQMLKIIAYVRTLDK